MSSTHGLIADTIPFSNVDGPGNRFVVFLQGCNFNCIACHNPQTIRTTWPADAPSPPRQRSVDEVLAEIRRAAPFLSGVTVSGGEATQQPDFVESLFRAIRTDPGLAGLTCFVDTNGDTPPATWTRLESVMDGAMVDLKCLDPDVHLRMTGHSNERVLASIRLLHQRRQLHEVRLLLVHGVNDGDELLRSTGRWLAEIDPTMRLVLIGFRAHGTRPHDPPLEEPSPDALHASAEVLAAIAPFRITVV